jgi:hypothetical protein
MMMEDQPLHAPQLQVRCKPLEQNTASRAEWHVLKLIIGCTATVASKETEIVSWKNWSAEEFSSSACTESPLLLKFDINGRHRIRRQKLGSTVSRRI